MPTDRSFVARVMERSPKPSVESLVATVLELVAEDVEQEAGRRWLHPKVGESPSDAKGYLQEAAERLRTLAREVADG